MELQLQKKNSNTFAYVTMGISKLSGIAFKVFICEYNPETEENESGSDIFLDLKSFGEMMDSGQWVVCDGERFC